MTTAPKPASEAGAEATGLDHQRKLHRWASAEPKRRFGDLFNLVCDRATLVVAWEQVASNRGARTAGVDAETRHAVERRGVLPFLEDLRSSLKDGSSSHLPVREATIPKRGGKVNRQDPSLHEQAVELRVGHRGRHPSVLLWLGRPSRQLLGAVY